MSFIILRLTSTYISETSGQIAEQALLLCAHAYVRACVRASIRVFVMIIYRMYCFNIYYLYQSGGSSDCCLR